MPVTLEGCIIESLRGIIQDDRTQDVNIHCIYIYIYIYWFELWPLWNSSYVMHVILWTEEANFGYISWDTVRCAVQCVLIIVGSELHWIVM